MHWTMRNKYKNLVVQPEVRTRCGALKVTLIWEDNIKMRLKNIGSNQGNIFVKPSIDWISLGHLTKQRQAPENKAKNSWFLLRAAKLRK
jgi:hypothetical protein